MHIRTKSHTSTLCILYMDPSWSTQQSRTHGTPSRLRNSLSPLTRPAQGPGPELLPQPRRPRAKVPAARGACASVPMLRNQSLHPTFLSPSLCCSIFRPPREWTKSLTCGSPALQQPDFFPCLLGCRKMRREGFETQTSSPPEETCPPEGNQ